jgi:adenine-specific DNA methylase
LTASRAAVLASLLPAWPDPQEAASDPRAARSLLILQKEFPNGPDQYRKWFLQILGIKGDPVRGRQRIAAARQTGERLAGNGYGYARAFTYSPTAEQLRQLGRLIPAGIMPTVLDLFAGGGSIPLEAGRLGCPVTANELNPVAAAILSGTIDLPVRLGPKFADTIRQWGGVWAASTQKWLEKFFPLRDNEIIAGYIWAHTVPCPVTGWPTPLAPDFWLARGKAGRDVAVRLEPDADTGRVGLSVVEGKGADQYGSRTTYKRGIGSSIWAKNQTFDGDYIRKCAQAGQMNEMLLALSVTRPGVPGRQFRVPTQADLAAVVAAETEVGRRLGYWEANDFIPTETIEFAHSKDRASVELIRGPRSAPMWRQMFAPRQLLTHATAFEQLRITISQARAELDDEQIKALALYFAFALDKAVDYNSIISSWDPTRLKVRNTFDRHDLSFKWSFAELDGAHATIPWVVEQVADAYAGIAKLVERPGQHSSLLSAGDTPPPQVAQVIIRMGSATGLPDVPDRSVDVIVTDPPYYDNVMYSVCSDFFLVWLRRALRDTWPQYCQLALSDKQNEAVANSSLFRDVATSQPGQRNKAGKTASQLADQHYERLLTQSFQEAHRVLKDTGVMTVMFTHKRVDAWDTLGKALINSGFSIYSSWPVHTESEHSLHQAKKNAAASTIILTCRKRPASTQPGYWDQIQDQISSTARHTARQLADQGMRGIDLTLATFGPTLAVLSQHWPVYTGQLNDDGSQQTISPDDALNLARHEVNQLQLGTHFDPATDWWLLAWMDFAAAEFPADEALKLSRGTNIDLDRIVKQHKVATTKSGTVVLSSPQERRSARAFDPADSHWQAMLDALHALMVVYQEDGRTAARHWLERTGNTDNPKFRELFEAALRAVPRIKNADGTFVRPEAGVLEGLRVTLFVDIAAPPEQEPAPVVQSLFDEPDDNQDE